MITVQTLGSSSKGNCYRLTSVGRSLLIECGLPWNDIRRKLNFETSFLDGCLCTHSHGDHFKAARDLMKAGIDVYATQETFEWGAIQPHHRAIYIETMRMFRPGGFWRVVAFDTQHDVTGSVGFIIGNQSSTDNLLFITDSAYCRWTFPDRFTTIMIEANFSDEILQRNVDAGHIEPARAKRIRESHLSIEKVIDFLKANDLSRCRQVHLLHLSDGNSNAELFKQMVQESTGIPVSVEG